MNDAGLSAGTSTITDSGGTVDIVLLVHAFREHAWLLFAGLLLMAGIALARASGLLNRLPPAVVPWLALGISVLTSVASGLTHGQTLMASISAGLLVGVTAIGSWETIGRRVRDYVAGFRAPDPPGGSPP